MQNVPHGLFQHVRGHRSTERCESKSFGQVGSLRLDLSSHAKEILETAPEKLKDKELTAIRMTCIWELWVVLSMIFWSCLFIYRASASASFGLYYKRPLGGGLLKQIQVEEDLFKDLRGNQLISWRNTWQAEVNPIVLVRIACHHSYMTSVAR